MYGAVSFFALREAGRPPWAEATGLQQPRPVKRGLLLEKACFSRRSCCSPIPFRVGVLRFNFPTPRFLAHNLGPWENGQAPAILSSTQKADHPMSTPSSPSSPTVPAQNTAPILIVLLLVDSLHFVFARTLLPLISPGVSAMYVLMIGTVMVGGYGLVRGQLGWRTARDHWRFFLVIGFLIAVSTNVNYEAVAFIDPGTAALLGKSGIVFGLLLSFVWLHENLSRSQIIGSVIALIGVAVIAYQPGDYLRLGSLLVVGAPFMYAIHAAIVKRYAGRMDFVDFFFYRLLFTSLFLLLFSTVRGALVLPSSTAWGLLILVAGVDVVLSRTLYYVALQRMKMSVHTIVLTASPVVAVVWSVAFFDVRPTPQQILGGLGVLVGVLIVTVRRR